MWHQTDSTDSTDGSNGPASSAQHAQHDAATSAGATAAQPSSACDTSAQHSTAQGAGDGSVPSLSGVMLSTATSADDASARASSACDTPADSSSARDTCNGSHTSPLRVRPAGNAKAPSTIAGEPAGSGDGNTPSRLGGRLSAGVDATLCGWQGSPFDGMQLEAIQGASGRS